MERGMAVQPGSRTSSRHSFESRNKSPLSVTSSAEYTFASSRTSEDSGVGKSGVLVGTRTSLPPMKSAKGKLDTEKVTITGVPVYPRYGAGGQGRQQIQPSLPITRLLGNPVNSNFTPPRYKPRISGEGFRKLPEEVLMVILKELRKSHLQVGSLSCATCWMRDAINVGLSSRKWWTAARVALYEDILLNGTDSVVHTKKKYKMKHGTRLKLLRRTLRDRPDLAQIVKSLKVPSVPESAKKAEELEQYMNLVSSVIMACPNLERLPGFYPAYNHSFNRFVHALSTRATLKEAVWIINPSPFQRQRRYVLAEDSQHITSVMAPGQLLPEQGADFLMHHSRWRNLKTLLLHCNEGGTLDSSLFGELCDTLPSLQELHVSAFPAPAFNDSTLAYLPPLKSLRLDNLPGITDAGLSAMGSMTCSSTLTRLSLISLPVLSLPTIARLLSRLRNLTNLIVAQAPSPVLPKEEEFIFHPYLASGSLEYLHWEITNPSDDNATEILSKSIRYGGFPNLHRIRAPTDFDGYLQKLCQPRNKIELPGDRYRNLGPPGNHAMPSSQSMPSMPSSIRSGFSRGHSHSSSVSSTFVKSPTRTSFSMNNDKRLSYAPFVETREKAMSLLNARRMAQQRIDAALTEPKFQILISDEHGDVFERHAVGGYLGLISSEIIYTLRPDIDGADEAVVTVDGVAGLLDGGEEISVRDGCTGGWNINTMASAKTGKVNAGKERWWHTERGRWREVPLQKFFG